MSEDRPEPESDDGWGPTDSVDADRPGRGDDGAHVDDEEDDRKSKTGRIPIDLDRRATDRDGRATDRNGRPIDRDGRSTGGIDDGDDEDEYGPEPRSTPIEPGTPTLEHAVFVVLGALAMIAVVLRMASITI